MELEILSSKVYHGLPNREAIVGVKLVFFRAGAAPLLLHPLPVPSLRVMRSPLTLQLIHLKGAHNPALLWVSALPWVLGLCARENKIP